MVKRTSHYLADWIFAFSQTDAYASRDDIIWCFGLYDKMIQIFRKHELLVDPTLTIPKLTWSGASKKSEDRLKVDAIVNKILFTTEHFMTEEVIKIIDSKQISTNNFIKPYNWKITGYGKVYDKQGNIEKLHDVITIESMLADNFEIWIKTYYDVWLPCNLDGIPQPEVHRYNAPRLEQAMEEVEAILGAPPVKDIEDGPEYSDYCYIDGYKLLNATDDIDGSIIPINLNGHVK